MSRQLIIMRHAKSGWGGAARDFDRTLNGRGRKDAPAMAQWLANQNLIPGTIVVSPAQRTRETAAAFFAQFSIDSNHTLWDERVYEAGRRDLLSVLADIPAKTNNAMLIGHNPGMEDLCEYLAENYSVFAHHIKPMPTAALVCLELGENWMNLHEGCARIVKHMRPKDILGNLPPD